MSGELVSVAQRDGSLVAALAGELDLATIPEVEASLAPAMAARPRELVIDLTQVEFLDSTALRMLFRLAAEQRAHRGSFVVVAPSRTLARRVIDLAALGETCEIVETAP